VLPVKPWLLRKDEQKTAEWEKCSVKLAESRGKYSSPQITKIAPVMISNRSSIPKLELYGPEQVLELAW